MLRRGLVCMVLFVPVLVLAALLVAFLPHPPVSLVAPAPETVPPVALVLPVAAAAARQRATPE